MNVLKSFHPIIKYDYHVQDEWNEIQTWSLPQPLTNQEYDYINMVVMRFTYMNKRGGKHENYDANVTLDKNILLSSSIQCAQGLSHSQDIPNEYDTNWSWNQLLLVEYQHKIKSKDVTNTKFHQAS